MESENPPPLDEEQIKLLAQLERNLMTALPPDDPGGKILHHYTDVAGFKGIMTEGKVWATHFRHTNDRGELSAGDDIVQDEAKKLIPDLATDAQRFIIENFALNHETRRLSQIANVYVSSFSERGDQLSQWRGYGGRAAGYALGFSDLHVPTAENADADLGFYLVKCIYAEKIYPGRVREELIEIAKGFEREVESVTKQEHADPFARAAINIALRRIGALVPRYKVQAFEEEQEWRLVGGPLAGHEKAVVKHRTTGSTVTPYVEYPVRSDDRPMDLRVVRLGPNIDPTVGLSGARLLVEHYGHDPKIVTTSAIPFRG